MSFQWGWMSRSAHSGKVFVVLWKVSTAHGHTNPFLQLGSVHHPWALLRAGVNHLFLHFPDNPLGWGEAKKVYSFWATPTSAWRFPPLGRRAILDPLTGGTRPQVSCNVKSSFGWCLASFKWLLLHFVLLGLSPYEKWYIQTRAFMSCTLLGEASLSRAEGSSKDEKKKDIPVHEDSSQCSLLCSSLMVLLRSLPTVTEGSVDFYVKHTLYPLPCALGLSVPLFCSNRSNQ